MNASPRILTLAILFAAACSAVACSNGPDQSDASAEGGTDAAKDVYKEAAPIPEAGGDTQQPPSVTLDCTQPPASDAGSTDAGSTDAGSTDAGDDGSTDAGDDGATEAGSSDAGSSDAGSTDAGGSTKGSCIAINDASVTCNPVTNEGCNFDAGEACDFGQNAGEFQCYTSPPNTAAICTSCDYQNGPACLPTLTCVDLGNGTTHCGRWCCVDSDCGGSAHCDTTYDPPVGICVQ